jgi:DNA-directed RNA polymerase subunit L
MMNVDSGQIKGKMKGVDLTSTQLATFFPKDKVADSHILITRLRSNEELHFKARVVKRTARFNSAFSPVSLANFFYIQDESKINKDMNILDKERTFYKNKFGEATKIRFEIEPINYNLSAKFLINQCIDILIQKLKNISENINSKEINVSFCDDLKNTVQFVIANEDDTIGNILQSIIHNKYIRNKSNFNDITCSYIGYICPHPLKEELVIKLTLEDQTDINKFTMFIDSHCKIIIDELSIIKNEWNKFIDNK